MRRATSALLSSKAIKLKWLGLGSGALTALIIAVVWFAWPREKAMSAMLLETGYFENVLPDTFSGPGTINTVEFLSDGKVALHPTCNVDAGFLADKIQRSQTIERELKQTLEKKLDVSGEIRKKLSEVVGVNQIRSVHLKLENASILLITDEALLSARHELLKGTCEEAVLENISAGGIVCQTRAVLEADVTYEFGYNDRVSIGERARLSAQAAEKLNLDARQKSDDRISGRQLFFGVKLAPNAITISSGPGDQLLKCSILK